MYSLLLLFIKPSIAVSHKLTFCLISATWGGDSLLFLSSSLGFFLLQFFRNRYYRLCVGPSDHHSICASIPRRSAGESLPPELDALKLLHLYLCLFVLIIILNWLQIMKVVPGRVHTLALCSCQEESCWDYWRTRPWQCFSLTGNQ